VASPLPSAGRAAVAPELAELTAPHYEPGKACGVCVCGGGWEGRHRIEARGFRAPQAKTKSGHKMRFAHPTKCRQRTSWTRHACAAT
jgi:hypothetical protein